MIVRVGLLDKSDNYISRLANYQNVHSNEAVQFEIYLFTEEQMASLRQNPYVYSVSSTVLVLRKSFKEIFYKEYMEGAYPKAILKKYGFDTTMLGKNRIDSIVYHIKKEYAKYGGFYEGRRPANRHETACATEQTTEEELKSLRHEVEYLRQEVDFLKKISVIRKPRK